MLGSNPKFCSQSDEAKNFFQESNFLVLKVTDYCNLRCKYCHQDSLTGKPILMAMETVKNAVQLILESSRASIVYIEFHGGEPLLASDAFFYDAVEFSRRTLETKQRQVKFFLQTNLTLVNSEREKMLRDLGIGISFSLDGPPHINDKLRGGGKKVLENFRRMKQQGTRTGTIALIQHSNWDKMEEVLAFFHQQGLHDVRFNLMAQDGRGKGVKALTAEEFFAAKKTILNYMLKTKGQSVVDSALFNSMKRFAETNGAPCSSKRGGCEAFFCQGGRSLYSVNPDGTFFACDRIAEKPHWAMGNVNRPFTGGDAEFVQEKRSQFHQKSEWWARCERCDAKKICEFSCSAYYIDEVNNREIDCSLTRKLWQYFTQRSEDIFTFLSLKLPPISVDERIPLRKQTEETWVVKDIACDATYNHLSFNKVLANNIHYQLTQRGNQYFLYVFGRNKIFEVDKIVAEIARFNGRVQPHVIKTFLKDTFSKEELRITIESAREKLPELFYGGIGAENSIVPTEALCDHASFP